MPIDYSFNSHDRTIEVVCFGELVIGEILGYFEALRSDASVGKGAVELVDLSRVKYFNVDFRQASQMPIGYGSAHQEKAIKGTVLYGANEINEGLAELIRSHFLRSLPLHRFLVVKSESEAKAAAREILGRVQRDE